MSKVLWLLKDMLQVSSLVGKADEQNLLCTCMLQVVC